MTPGDAAWSRPGALRDERREALPSAHALIGALALLGGCTDATSRDAASRAGAGASGASGLCVQGTMACSGTSGLPAELGPVGPDASASAPPRPSSEDAGASTPAEQSSNVDGGPAPGAADASVTALDRCDVGVLDPANPPRTLELRGNLGAHDPVIIAADGLYRYFSTGDGISVKTSPDLLEWTQQPDVFPTTPSWFQERVPEYMPRNIWAPDIAYFGGQYHLYYSVSSFGSNRSCIGHATRPTLAAGDWLDRDPVFCSNPPGQVDDFNAIDPNVILDEGGTPWMSFGSFWSGIKMIRLDLEGNRADGSVIDLASRGGGAIEAPFIVRRCGFYYLFVSFDACCQGADSTYNTRVGRSAELLGPYVGRDGIPLLDGGGTLLLAAAGDWVGPGHNAIFIDATRAYNVYHAYAASNGASQLRIAELAWDAEGWPVSGGP